MKQTRLLILFVCTFIFANTFAANRYWVAASSANWADASSWSETSGGTSGAIAPTTGDDVFFESGSAITVTLGAAVTVNSITFTSRNVTFAGAYAITTNNMTVTTSQVKFVDNVTVNSAITFSGTSPRITQYTTTYTKLFTMGNGGAFSLTGNSATNYFGGNTSSANTTYAFNTTSALTVYFDPSTSTPLTLGGLTVTRGSITLGNNVTTIRATLSATNSQELILAPNVTFTMATGGSSTLTASANGGVINASASGSKVIVSTANAGFLDGTKRFFKTGSVINHFEFNSATKIFKLFESVRVRNITKTAGTIETTASKTITVEAGGSITGDGIVGTDVTYESATTRYWVGGSAGSWFNAANWGTSSGNTSTPRIPAYADNVVFDNSTGNENPIVTLTDHVTAADINFTNSNVTFAGADSIKTNSMTVNSSQVQFVDHVKVNSSLTFSGTNARITQLSTTSGRAFICGNGGAFTLYGNSTNNYFTGNTNAYYTFNTESPLTVYFNPTTTTAGALVVTKGLITLANNVNTVRITLTALNNQELILGPNVTLTHEAGGSSGFADANAGRINASASGSKYIIKTIHATFVGNQTTGAPITGKIFKENTTINHLEYNSSAVFHLPQALTVSTLTLTSGQINNTTNNITIPSDGNLVVGAGTTTAALNASLPSVPTSVTATAGDGQASVAFTVPANGGSLISNYKYSLNDGTYVEFSPAKTTSPIVITGLTNTTAYTVKLKAVNAIGEGTGSDASGSVTPDDVLNDITVSTAKGASELALTPVSDVVVDKDGLLTINQMSTINSLSLSAGGKVTNASTLNAATLTINSNATDGTGTYLDNGTTTVTGTTTVNQSFQHPAGALRTWYVTPPVASASPTGMSIIKSYDELTYSWSSSLTTMDAKVGYQVVPAAAANDISFTGTLNNGNQNIPLISRDGTANKAGFNLIGNPYPSYLDWSLVTNPSNTAVMRSTTMWYRTKKLNQSSELVYQFWTVNGDGLTSPNGASPKIPPMQAFWVRANSGGGTLALTNSMRSHAPDTDKLLKAPAAKNTEMTLVRLQVSNGTNTDEAVIYFSENAQNDFDKLDAPKMSNDNVAIPEIYTTLGTEQFVINGMNTIPLDTPIGLGFVAGNASTFSLTANEISNLPSGLKLILKDNVTKTETDLTDGVSTYQFSPAVTSTDRFSVIFRTSGAVTGLENTQDNSIIVYNNAPQQLTVICNDNLIVGSMVSVYNALGEKLLSRKLTSASTQIAGSFIPGVYVVKMNNITKKVIVN